MVTTEPEEVALKRVRKLKVAEVRPKRRYFWAGPVVAVFLALMFLLNAPVSVIAQDDYTFGTENATKGTSTNPTERNTENAVYNTLKEGDQYTDTNFSGSSENIVVGTTGGGAFPSALDTDDATRRNYIEASSGGSPTYQVLRPNADGSPLTFTPTPTGTHYTTVDETTAGGNGDTDYVTGVSNANEDTFGMSDASNPGGSPNFDVRMWHWSRGITTSSCAIQYGLDIAGTNYLGGTATMTSITYANFSYTWTLNPSTSAEWTLTQINALGVYLYMTDANPDARTTQVGLVITITPTASYTLDAQITFSSVASTSQTTGFQVLCQGYRNGDTESVNVQAWNYTSSVWVTKVTISAGSDTDYNFNLLGWAANCERSSGNIVLLRLIDASNGDATQTTTYLDVLKINRIELGYALDVDMSATSVAQYGNITLRIKGYTSAEQFNVNVWNYTSSAYDVGKLAITSLSNAWQTTIDLCDDHHRSGTTVKIQFVDGIASTSDLVQDTLYLDVVWVTRYHTDPTITLYGATPTEVNLGSSITFWSTYSDYDNEAPTYVYAHIGSTDYSMSANDSDTAYFDGKLYGLVKSDIPAGNITYYFKVKDANSGDVTTSPVALSVNTKPTLTSDGVTPSGGNPGTYTFFVTYTDADSNSPQYVKATIGGIDYTMTYNGSGGGYHYDKVMSGGTTAYSFKTEDYRSGVVSTTPKNLIVNNPPTLNGFGRAPGDPVYVTTELNFTMTFTDLDNTMPTSIKWREDGGAIQNVTMLEVDPLDTTTSDGKAYYLLKYLTHGVHNYDFGASDGQYWASGGSNSVTIANRAPDITNGPGAHVDQYRNVAWYYDFDATDPDSDAVGWEVSGPAWLSIDSNGNLSGTTSNTPGEYSTTVYANDSYSGSDFYAFVLHVNNQNPSISSTGNTTQTEGTFLSYQIVASDPDGDSLSYALSSNASWASINGAWVNGTAADPGWYEFTTWANDSYSGSDFEHWHLEVTVGSANNPPYFTSSPIETGYNNTAYLYDANGVDPESQPLTFTLYGNGTSWLSYGSSNGTIWGYPTTVGWYYCNLSLSDGVNEVWQNWTLTISEGTPNNPSGSGGPFTLSIGVMVLIAILAATMVMVWRSS